MQFIQDGGTVIGMVDEVGGRWRAFDKHDNALGTFATLAEAEAAIPRPVSMSEREVMLGRRDKPLRSDAGKARGRRPGYGR
jgi:hypothetical protein